MKAADAVMAINHTLPGLQRLQFTDALRELAQRNVDRIRQRDELMLVQLSDIQQSQLFAIGEPLGKFLWCHEYRTVAVAG